MTWITYDYNYPAATEINKHGYDAAFTVEEFTEGFFFTYMAYSPVKDNIFLYIKLANGTTHRIPVEDI